MQRPTAVTVFGVLNLAFGALAFFCSPVSLAILKMPDDPRNPILHLAHTSSYYRTWLIVACGIAMIGGIVQIAAGIGLLQLKPWARVTAIGYAIFGIVFGVFGQVVNLVLLSGAFRNAMHSGPQAAGAIGGMIGGMFGGCIGLIYPALLIFFLTRPTARAAFVPPVTPPVTQV
jgi:hypothetical protein